ncbi:MAG: GtrA family protein [Bacteroidetes bacterium]|nr:GtrA family protein [Bacteroidota bacterium]
MTDLLLAIDFTTDFSDMLDKFWRFFIVGGGGFAIDVGITYLLLKVFKWHKYLSNSIGFLCGVTFNYTFNRMWTFSSNDPQIMLQYTKFALIGIIGLIIVNSVIYILHTRNKYSFFWSKVAAMILFMFWNFSANYFYTFG